MILSTVVVLAGILSPADPLVLESVEIRRVRYGYGLTEFASPAMVRLALDDCQYLGSRGWLVVGGAGYPAYVVDCCEEAGCLAGRGLVADIAPQWSLGHEWAEVYLYRGPVRTRP